MRSDGDPDPAGASDDFTLKIVRSVADRERVDPTDLPPLADVISPDALEALLWTSPDASVEFTYHGWTVSATGDGNVTLCDPDED